MADEDYEFRVVRAIRDAIPTRRHANMLFDLVADRFGPKAWIETSEGGTRRFLFRREAPGTTTVVPWPILSLRLGGRLSSVMMIAGPTGEPPEPPPRPGEAPRLRGLGPGEIILHDGVESITVTYGEDGRWMEQTRGGGPDALAGVLPVLGNKSASPVERLAGFLASIDHARHGPGRVMLTVPVPGGPAAVWNCGLLAIRRALFEGSAPAHARWAAADGFTGEAVAFGETRQKALAAWRSLVEGVRPYPEVGVEPPQWEGPVLTSGDPVPEDAEGGFTLRAPPSDVPMPERLAANTPGALVPLHEPPGYAAPFGAWLRVLGSCGETYHAALRRDPNGFTLVGDRLLDVIDVVQLKSLIEAVDAGAPEFLSDRFDAFPAVRPRADSNRRIYRLVEEGTGLPVTPSIAEMGRGSGFDPGIIVGERVRWQAWRQWWDRV